MAINFSFDNVKSDMSPKLKVDKGTNKKVGPDGQLITASTGISTSPLQAATEGVSPDQSKMVGTPAQKQSARDTAQVDKVELEKQKAAANDKIERMKAAETFGSLKVQVTDLLEAANTSSALSADTTDPLDVSDVASVGKLFTDNGLTLTTADMNDPVVFAQKVKDLKAKLATTHGDAYADQMASKLASGLSNLTADAVLKSNFKENPQDALNKASLATGIPAAELAGKSYTEFVKLLQDASTRDMEKAAVAEARVADPTLSPRETQAARDNLIMLGQTGERSTAASIDNLYETLEKADDVTIGGQNYGSLKELLDSDVVSANIAMIFDPNASEAESKAALSKLSEFKLADGSSLKDLVEKNSATFKAAVANLTDEERGTLAKISAEQRDAIKEFGGLSPSALSVLVPNMNTTLVDVKSQAKTYSGLISLAKTGTSAKSGIESLLVEGGIGAANSLNTAYNSNPVNAEYFVNNAATWISNNKIKKSITEAMKPEANPAVKKGTILSAMGGDNVVNQSKYNGLKALGYSDDEILANLNTSYSAVGSDIGTAASAGTIAPAATTFYVGDTETADKLLNKVMSDNEVTDDELAVIGSVAVKGADKLTLPNGQSLQQYMDGRINTLAANKVSKELSSISSGTFSKALADPMAFDPNAPGVSGQSMESIWSNMEKAASSINEKIDAMRQSPLFMDPRFQATMKPLIDLRNKWAETLAKKDEILANWNSKRGKQEATVAEQQRAAAAAREESNWISRNSESIDKKLYQQMQSAAEAAGYNSFSDYDSLVQQGLAPSKEELRVKIAKYLYTKSLEPVSESGSDNTNGGW